MKQQSVGVVLCALLLTTFGHEVLNRHLIARAARLAHHPQAKQHSLARENTEEHCVKICKPVDSNLTISINANASLVAVYNATAKVGLVLDVKAGLVGIFNLSTTGGVIFDLRTKSAVEVRGLWQVNVSWEVALRTLSSTGLRVLYGKGQSISFTEVEIEAQVALNVLSSGEYDVSAKESIGALIEISNSLVVSFKAVLVVIKSGSFSVKISLRRFIEIIRGLSNEISNIKGGIQVLIKFGVTICLKIVLTANSTFKIAGYIWQQLAGADIGHIFGDLHNSSNVLKLLAGLGGNSTEGPNGLATVLYEVILIVHGNGCVEKLIRVLFEFLCSNDHSVGKKWIAAVEDLYKLIVRLGLTIKLKAVVELLVKIKKGEWVEQNINISAIITALITANYNNGLKVTAFVLNLLQTKIIIELAIATCFLDLIKLLASPGGSNDFGELTGIKIGAELLSGSANALVQILRGVSLKDLISGGTSGFVKFLSGLPVVSDLLAVIDAAFKGCGIKLTLGSILNRAACKTILIEIISCFKHCSGSLPIPIVGDLGPARKPSLPNGSENATGAGAAGENSNVGGGTGGDRGDGGNLSGNSGNVSVGVGSGINVSMNGSSEGNMNHSNEIGNIISGGAESQKGTVNRKPVNVKNLGKNDGENTPKGSGNTHPSTNASENGTDRGGDGGDGGDGGNGGDGGGGGDGGDSGTGRNVHGGNSRDGNDHYKEKEKRARHYQGKHYFDEKRH